MASVKDQIRNEIMMLGGKKYDHDGCGSLSLRPDVAFFACDELFPPAAAGSQTADLEAAGMPHVHLNKDGTIELCFELDGRELLLTIQGGGVVTFLKILEDGQTSIEGTLRSPWVLNGVGSCTFEHFDALHDLLSWLAVGF